MKIYFYTNKKTGKKMSFVTYPSREEQEVAFDNCIGMIMNHTGWVLDMLDYLPQFEVNWEDYHSEEYKERRRRTRNKV